MKLWLLSQDENTSWDSAMVVAAKTETEARNTPPYEGSWEDNYSGWYSFPDKVSVKYLGEADPSIKAGIILDSYHAG